MKNCECRKFFDGRNFENLENDRKQLEEQAEKLKRYGIALKRIVALYAKGESSICDIMENGSGTQYVFACTLDTDVLNERIDVPQISLKAE